MTDIEHSGFSELDRWLGLAKRTRELLDVAIGEGELPAGGADYLAERTLPHVERVQAGFVGWLRSESAGVEELRYLLLRAASLRVDGPNDEAERRAADAEAAAERAVAGAGPTARPALRVPEPWSLAALVLLPRPPRRGPFARRTRSTSRQQVARDRTEPDAGHTASSPAESGRSAFRRRTVLRRRRSARPAALATGRGAWGSDHARPGRRRRPRWRTSPGSLACPPSRSRTT
jgi:hypothetical protein